MVAVREVELVRDVVVSVVVVSDWMVLLVVNDIDDVVSDVVVVKLVVDLDSVVDVQVSDEVVADALVLVRV